MNKKVKVLLWLVFFAVITAVSGSLYFWFILDRPFLETGKNQDTEIIINNGESINTLAADLESKRLINSSYYFILRYKILSKLNKAMPFQAGRFLLSGSLKPSEILDELTNPENARRFYVNITIPPGSDSRKTAQIISDSGLSGYKNVITAIKELASSYPVVNNSEGLQGYLFPDTYKFEKPLNDSTDVLNQKAEEIIRKMADEFFRELSVIEPDWKELTPVQLNEKIILASIVEREYRVKEEAPEIAAVFNNRISKGMPLQSCATVAYVILNTPEGKSYKNEYLKYNRRIFERYLKIDSPYNTYLYKGLPPGPICNPGMTALEASFFPADSDALYFVVKDPEKGTHYFSRDYSEHLEARKNYLENYVIKE